MKNYIGPRDLNYRKKVEKALKQKSLSTLKADLQKVFNLFIRLRDTVYLNGKAYFICISCNDRKEVSEMNAGHFFPVGGNEAVRYDEDNTNGQCIACNLHKHGNGAAYAVNLLKKIGKERFDLLNWKRQSLSKLMPFEVEYLIQEYKAKIEQLKQGRK